MKSKLKQLHHKQKKLKMYKIRVSRRLAIAKKRVTDNFLTVYNRHISKNGPIQFWPKNGVLEIENAKKKLHQIVRKMEKQRVHLNDLQKTLQEARKGPVEYTCKHCNGTGYVEIESE